MSRVIDAWTTVIMVTTMANKATPVGGRICSERGALCFPDRRESMTSYWSVVGPTTRSSHKTPSAGNGKRKTASLALGVTSERGTMRNYEPYSFPLTAVAVAFSQGADARGVQHIKETPESSISFVRTIARSFCISFHFFHFLLTIGLDQVPGTEQEFPVPPHGDGHGTID